MIRKIILLTSLLSASFLNAATTQGNDSDQLTAKTDAQNNYVRDTWYIEFALFPTAGIDIYTKGSNEEHHYGHKDTFGLQFGAGATVNPYLLLGGELSGFGYKNEERQFDGFYKRENRISISNLLGVATFFPWEKGLFLRGGFGISQAKLERKEKIFGYSKTYEDTVSGVAAVAGLGYAWWLGKSFNLSAKLDYSEQFYNKKIKFTDDKVTLDRVSTWMLGIGFHWY